MANKINSMICKIAGHEWRKKHTNYYEDKDIHIYECQRCGKIEKYNIKTNKRVD